VPIPIFIIYELLIRIQQLAPDAGTYVSHTFNNQGAIIITTNRTFRVRKALLNRQFKDPKLVSNEDLLLLIKK